MKSSTPLFLLLGALSTTAAPLYTITPIGATAPNTYVIGLGISSNAQYVTGSQNPSWVWNSGNITSLNALTGVTWGEARAVGNNGHVAGYGNVSGTQRALYWDGTTLYSFLPSGATSANAFGLSDTGLVFGAGLFSGGSNIFVWDPIANTSAVLNSIMATSLKASPNGTAAGNQSTSGGNVPLRVTGNTSGLSYTTLGLPSGSTGGTTIWSINDSGVGVGYSNVSGVQRAIQWTGTTPSILANLPGGTAARADDINNAGDAVGQILVSSLGWRATVWQAGTPYDLNSQLVNPISGLTLDWANSIAEDGSIIAMGNQGGFSRAFLLTPAGVPEPGTAGLALVSLGAILAWRRRATTSASS
jgi:MYXO-CTERM domain-containing protein